jgi:hypothetical protein
MSKGLKILLSLADLALLLVIVAVLFAAFGLGDVISKIAQGAAFSWENFDPLSREPGALGITPLIWTALAAVPLAVFSCPWPFIGLRRSKCLWACALP